MKITLTILVTLLIVGLIIWLEMRKAKEVHDIEPNEEAAAEYAAFKARMEKTVDQMNDWRIGGPKNPKYHKENYCPQCGDHGFRECYNFETREKFRKCTRCGYFYGDFLKAPSLQNTPFSLGYQGSSVAIDGNIYEQLADEMFRQDLLGQRQPGVEPRGLLFPYDFHGAQTWPVDPNLSK